MEYLVNLRMARILVNELLENYVDFDVTGQRNAGQWLISVHADNITYEWIAELIEENADGAGTATTPTTEEA